MPSSKIFPGSIPIPKLQEVVKCIN